MRAEVVFGKGNEQYDGHHDDGMSNETNEPRLKSTGKGAKQRRQGVVTGDEETGDEEDEEDDLSGSMMTTSFYVKRFDVAVASSGSSTDLGSELSAGWPSKRPA
jgi:hypothetical protein